MRFTKASLFLLLIFTCHVNVVFCQESQPERVIRILGVVPIQESDLVPLTPTHLGAIVQAWNNTGLPARTGVTLEILNGGIAQTSGNVIVVGPGDAGAQAIQKDAQIMSLRNAAAADVVILFTRQVSVPLNGGVAAGAAPIPRTFVQDPNEWNLDLTGQNTGYVALANPTFEPFTTSAHEFGHLFGGGHSLAGNRLHEDCRAKVTPSMGLSVNVFDDLPFVVPFRKGFFATAIASPVGDFPDRTPREALNPLPVYSSVMGINELGDASHNNVHCLMEFALSVANYYDRLQAPPPKLFAPINLRGNFVGCDGLDSLYEIFWDNDPRTTAIVTTYGLYSLDANDPTYKFEYFSNTTSTKATLRGASVRVKVSACSDATTCSGLSAQYFEAASRCPSQNN